MLVIIDDLNHAERNWFSFSTDVDFELVAFTVTIIFNFN
tara:strand:- start:496 stop:612 length:117 start_codon:yes stop_codon:yes gene_type:complete